MAYEYYLEIPSRPTEEQWLRYEDMCGAFGISKKRISMWFEICFFSITHAISGVYMAEPKIEGIQRPLGFQNIRMELLRQDMGHELRKHPIDYLYLYFKIVEPYIPQKSEAKS